MLELEMAYKTYLFEYCLFVFPLQKEYGNCILHNIDNNEWLWYYVMKNAF